MFIYKKLKASDANTIAFEAHKEWNINKDNTSSLGITLVETSYSSASRDTYSLLDINHHKQYFQLNHLFYKDALFNYGSLLGGLDYNNQEKRLYDKATIISLSQKTFGSSVQKGTFLFNNLYKDDSKGNLYANTDNLTDYPLDKERTFYLAPVKGFKHVDLTRDPKTGEPIVNHPSTYNDLKLDDSLYINPVEYISCSFARNTTINCTEIDLTNGYIKAPNSNNYNFGNEDFTITFYYQTANISTTKYVLAKSKTKTIVGYPESNLNGSLKNTHGSASLLQPKEVDAGKAFPFEIIQRDRIIEFKRADQDTEVSHTSAVAIAAGDTLYHIACVKTGSELKIYLDGALSNGTGTDTTGLCQNKADLFIGTDPTISSSKLDNTHDQSISQLMIWNRGLTATEIANVSESIDGSPYVGNIFYENGIVTLTSPKVNNSTLTSLVDNTGVINLFSTPFTQDEDDENPASPTPSFSSSLTFTSSVETISDVDGSDIYSTLIYNSTHLSASINGEEISLISKPYALLEDYTINPIVSESVRSFETYSELNNIVDAIPGGPGTASGETGTDADSITVTNQPQPSYIGLRLAENQTVTQSINILHISNSQALISENFTGSDSTIPSPFNTAYASGTGYVDTLYNGLYVKATAPNNHAFYSGSLSHTGSSLYPNEDPDGFKPIEYNTSIYNVPAGAESGASYLKLVGGSWNTGVIRILEDVTLTSFGTFGPATFSYSIKNTGITPNVGDNFSFKVYLMKSTVADPGYAEVLDSNFHSGNVFGFSLTGGFQISPGNPAFAYYPKEDDVYFLKLALYEGTSGNLDGNQRYQIEKFSITSPNNIFSNKLRITTDSLPTEVSSLYKINLNKIAPNDLLPSPNGDLIGLNQNDLYENLGVKVLLWSEYNSLFHLVTQSFYVSGSSPSSNTFSYTHQTSDENDELLYLDILADVASNTIPSTISNLDVIHNDHSTLIPISSSFGIGASTLGASTGLFSLEEISGSNVVQISSDLTSSFTDVSNLTSSILFNDISNFITLPSPTGPVDILGFVGADQTKVIIDGTYLVTSSFSDTASLDRGNYISGSASIDIADGKGLYIVDNVTLATTSHPSTPLGILSTQKVKIQTKTNGTVVDTRYVSGDINNQNPFQQTNDKLHLGVLDNTNNVSFEFTVVDDSNIIDKVTKDQGFSINEIQITQLTSSNEVTLVNNGPFLFNLDALYFSSSHIDIGNAAFPFNIGAITASIASISADNTTITLDSNYLITSSLSDALFHVSGAENGPFIISASHKINNAISGLTPSKLYSLSQSISNTNVNDVSNQGFGIIPKISFNINDNYEEVDGTNSSITEFKTTFNDLAYPLTYNFFVSGVASPLYPDGPITASSLSYTQSFTPSIKLTAISGSNISSGPQISEAAFSPYDGYSSNIMGITSSHIDTGISIPPLFTIGKLDVGILELVGGQIKIDETLFITASSDATGSSLSSSFNAGDYHFTPSNPINAYNVLPEMLGGTFSFTDLGSTETSTYQITNISPGEGNVSTITLLNQGGGADAIQTIDVNDLNATPPVTVAYTTIVNNEFTIQYKNSHLIFENEYHCTVDEDEYNHTLNPTARKLKDIDKGDLANFATGSNFKPYVTTVGLYNEGGELLVVGKLGQPIKMSDETDTTFVIRYDT